MIYYQRLNDIKTDNLQIVDCELIPQAALYSHYLYDHCYNLAVYIYWIFFHFMCCYHVKTPVIIQDVI